MVQLLFDSRDRLVGLGEDGLAYFLEGSGWVKLHPPQRLPRRGRDGVEDARWAGRGDGPVTHWVPPATACDASMSNNALEEGLQVDCASPGQCWALVWSEEGCLEDAQVLEVEERLNVLGMRMDAVSSRNLDELGFYEDVAPPEGFSVWQGCFQVALEGPRGDEEHVPVGRFRSLTEAEWGRLRLRQRLWPVERGAKASE